MIVSALELFEALEEQIGRDKARVIVKYVEQKVEKDLNQKTTVFATKEDLTKEISYLRAELLRTIYLVGIVQLLGIIGSVIAIVKYMK